MRGDRVEIFPAYEEARAIRIEFSGDTVEAIREIDPLRGTTLRQLEKITIYPASHYVTTDLTRRQAMAAIEEELSERLPGSGARVSSWRPSAWRSAPASTWR